METIRITQDDETKTYSLTIIGDVSHGYRTYSISEEDMRNLIDIIDIQ